jgi:exopolyphosphatase / guanosine-5'-triphosphate,3'-diphosphate pyrophosphatase
MKLAIIDLGTNTFQFIAIEQTETGFCTLYEESLAPKIGQGGISDGIISPEGIARALATLHYFKQKANELGIAPENIRGIATSAVRNASNGQDFVQKIFSETGIQVDVIDGNQEATLIYEGVKYCMPLGKPIAMIMDIGGGSVEFILCNEKRIFWKQSFEIGGQRLMDKFMTSDPISEISVRRLYEYAEQQLLPLTNAVHQYAPEILIGSAGSFETLIDMYYAQTVGHLPPTDVCAFDLPISAFRHSFDLLLHNNREGRMALQGMKNYRVDMIVVGVCLIDFVLKRYNISQIKVSNYSLKEGVISRIAMSTDKIDIN